MFLFTVCVQRVSDVRIFKVWQQISAAPGSYRFMCTGKDGGGGEEGGGGGKNFKPPGDIKSFKCHKCGHENKYDLAGKGKFIIVYQTKLSLIDISKVFK